MGSARRGSNPLAVVLTKAIQRRPLRARRRCAGTSPSVGGQRKQEFGPPGSPFMGVKPFALGERERERGERERERERKRREREREKEERVRERDERGERREERGERSRERWNCHSCGQEESRQDRSRQNNPRGNPRLRRVGRRSRACDFFNPPETGIDSDLHCLWPVPLPAWDSNPHLCLDPPPENELPRPGIEPGTFRSSV